jgi:hypothetical protein
MSTNNVMIATLSFLGVALVQGCGREYCVNQRDMVEKVEGSISYHEGALTATKRRELEASCRAKYPNNEREAPEGTRVDSNGRRIVPWGRSAVEYPSPARCKGDETCMVIVPHGPLNMFVRWAIPEAPGDYRLSDVRGELCETYPDSPTNGCAFDDIELPHCVPLDGRLLVHSVGPICETGACNILDADLTLGGGSTDSTMTAKASAEGTAHLSLVYEDYGRRCYREPTKLK